VNPLSAEQSVMRDTLYAGLLQNLSRNVRNQISTVRLYEIGRTYVPDPEGGQGKRPPAVETLHVSGVIHGLREGRHWTSKDATADFYDAKGAVEAILEALRIEGVSFEPVEDARYHPRASAQVKVAQFGAVGTLGELHPRLAKKLDLPADTYLFELDLTALYRAATLVPKFSSLTRFPAVLRDLAVVVDQELPSEQVRAVIREVGAPLVEDAQVFDSYTGKPLPEGRKNLAFALAYRAPDRTLTDEEVNQAHQKIVEEVNRRLGGSLRGSNPQ
jgi:phenylalanyl-tRNA synthetase beta chain